MKSFEAGGVPRPVEVWPNISGEDQDDVIAQEVPVALTYNGSAYAVMMATPLNLEALGLGFSLTEGILKHPSELYGVEIVEQDGSIEVSMTVSTRRFEALKATRRAIVGRTGCGVCGKESLGQIPLSVMPVEQTFVVTHKAVQKATMALVDHQPLQQLTGAVHGAAWCSLEGRILEVCEDVGRHNALDKLVGQLSPQNIFEVPGFLLMSSRASYEIIQKAAIAGIAMIVTLSAPTSLAIDLAASGGITLVGFSRAHRHLAYCHPHRLAEEVEEAKEVSHDSI